MTALETSPGRSLSGSLPTLCGGVVATVALVISVGWLTGSNLLIELYPGGGSVKLNAAVGYLAGGLALVSLAFHRKRPALVLGAGAFTIGLLTLAQYLFGLDLGIDELVVAERFASAHRPPGRMSPNSAAGLVGAGLLMVLAALWRGRRGAGWISGVGTALLIGTGLEGLLANTLDYYEPLLGRRYDPMSLQSAGIFILLGCGLLAYHWRVDPDQRPGVGPRWWPASAALATGLISLLLYGSLDSREKANLDTQAAEQTREAAALQEAELADRVLALVRMEKRWELAKAEMRDYWERDARLLLQHLPSFKAILLADPEFRPGWVATQTGLKLEGSEVLTYDPECAEAIRSAAASNTPVIFPCAHPTVLVGAFIIACPLVVEGSLTGWLVALVDGPALFKKAADLALPDMGIQLELGRHTLFTHQSEHRAGGRAWEKTKAGEWFGCPWRIATWPLPHFIATNRSALPETVVLAGLLVAGLLGLALQRGRTVRLHWVASEEAARQLEQELEAKLALQEQVLGISDRERSRIGQDLHDDLCQRLVSFTYACDRLARKLESDRPEVAGQAMALGDQIRESIGRTRELVRGLYPVSLQSGGLSLALGELAAAFSRQFGVSCEFECPQPVAPANPADAIHLYRIAQEAARNARQHGQATRILIRLTQADHRLCLRIQDNGRGLAIGANPSSGMGLNIMNYRARLLGGTLTLQPGEPTGLVVECVVPEAALVASRTQVHSPDTA